MPTIQENVSLSLLNSEPKSGASSRIPRFALQDLRDDRFGASTRPTWIAFKALKATKERYEILNLQAIKLRRARPINHRPTDDESCCERRVCLSGVQVGLISRSVRIRAMAALIIFPAPSKIMARHHNRIRARRPLLDPPKRERERACFRPEISAGLTCPSGRRGRRRRRRSRSC